MLVLVILVRLALFPGYCILRVIRPSGTTTALATHAVMSGVVSRDRLPDNRLWRASAKSPLIKVRVRSDFTQLAILGDMLVVLGLVSVMLLMRIRLVRLSLIRVRLGMMILREIRLVRMTLRRKRPGGVTLTRIRLVRVTLVLMHLGNRRLPIVPRARRMLILLIMLIDRLFLVHIANRNWGFLHVRVSRCDVIPIHIFRVLSLLDDTQSVHTTRHRINRGHDRRIGRSAHR